MFGRFLTALVFLALTISTARPSDPYINYGIVTNEMVDAPAFLNYGEFYEMNSSAPWYSLNTTVFTNRGLISGSIGFTFETVTPPFAKRSPAEMFVNGAPGRIEAFDGGGFLTFITGRGFSFRPDSGYFTVAANTIQNYGSISTGPSGNIRVLGENVDLTGGSLIVNPIGASSPFSSIFFNDFFLTETNFFPDSGIYDVSWGINVNTNMDTRFILSSVNPTIISSPPYQTTNSLNFFCTDILTLSNAASWVRMTSVNATNLNIQVVAVKTEDTNIFTDVRFANVVYPGGNPQGGFLTPIVELSAPMTDVFSGQVLTNHLYVIDQIASHTNVNLLVNIGAGTFRPAPLILTRSTPAAFLNALGSNDVIFPGIFDNPGYSNIIVTNLYAGYAAQIDSTSRRLPQLTDVGYTNAPGRVEIRGNNLDLTAAKIRAEGLVSIQATNIVSSQDAIIDVPHQDLRLGTTSAEPLRLQNLTRSTVQRLSGSLNMFTTVWTNVIASPDTNIGAIELHFTLLMVDATHMSTIQPVRTHRLELSSPGANGQVEIDSPLFVTDRLAIDSPSLTLDSSLILGKGLVWSPTNFLRLQNLTNNGYLQLTDLGQFQGANNTALKSFVNNGTVIAFSHLMNADYFENNGGIISTQYFRDTFIDSCLGITFSFTNSLASIGPININANTAKFENGRLSTAGDITLSGGILKMNKSGTSAGGAVNFNVTGVLTDSGSNAGNIVETRDGFKMGAVRPTGDLLGTYFRNLAPSNSIVRSTWASQDRGAVAEGFVNNLAMGTLEISGGSGTQFRFSGSMANSALYVDQLVISGLQANSIAEFTNRVTLNGINLYYGDVKSTNSVFTAERLNGLQLGIGRLIWVTNYAGANSGIDVVLSPTGPTVRMNRALRLSTVIDSDGDGIPNAYDDFPLTPATGLRITSAQVSSGKQLGFQFEAEASTRYVVEYTTNIQSGTWQSTNRTLESGSVGGKLTFTDEVATDAPQRFYRVRKIN